MSEVGACIVLDREGVLKGRELANPQDHVP